MHPLLAPLSITSLITASCLLLSGCISSDAQVVAVNQKRSFALTAALPASALRAPRFDNLKLLSFKSQPPYDANNLIVRRATGETVVDYYTTWIAAPQELIRVQALNVLRAKGLFKAVYDSTSGSLADAGLEGMVEEIFLDCRTDKPTAVITLRLSIIDETAPAFTLLWSAVATGSAPLESSGSPALISAFDKALTLALEQLTGELEKTTFPQKK
jgi:ABC-type uncharacterized transport system auxiliary subunit